jgi:hypothetical protein
MHSTLTKISPFLNILWGGKTLICYSVFIPLYNYPAPFSASYCSKSNQFNALEAFNQSTQLGTAPASENNTELGTAPASENNAELGTALASDNHS